jgi:protoporphyrinogen/coproporphyrinogen III oxidase
MIGTFDTEKREATVVGAGVAGLLMAYGLDREGYRVTLLEGRERAGGLIQTRRTDLGLAETAAHSLLASPAVRQLCAELGVELCEVRKDSRARFILRDGRLRKFPLSFKEAAGALGRAMFARAGAEADAQTLDEWGRRHVGEAAVDYLLTPLVRGIYGIQPSEVGVRAAFPSLEVPAGRTLLGSLARRSRRRSGPKAKGGKRMVAPLRGMGDLTSRLERSLEQKLGARFRRGINVTELPDAPNVVLATPAGVAARLLAGEAPALSRGLLGIEYTPLVSVTAFVPVEAIPKPTRGVGVLVPERENRQCLGILFNSFSFEGRVFDEARHASFTVLLGGSSRPHWARAADEEIAAAVSGELAALLGVRGEPSELVISRWPRAIPKYSAGLPSVWQSARETWCATPGRVLFGNYTGQVSLRGMIECAAPPAAPTEQEQFTSGPARAGRLAGANAR